MANAYWIDYLDIHGRSIKGFLAARSERGARQAMEEVEYFVADDPAGTFAIRLSRNNVELETIKRTKAPIHDYR